MTIDYKALAERVERLGNAYEHLADAAYIVEEVLGRWASATGGNTTEIRMAVSLLKGMTDAPAMWVQSNHLSWAGKQPFMARCAPTQLHPDFVPVYLHPAPQPTPEGWQVVPKQPTPEMLNVFHDRIRILCKPDRHEAEVLNDCEVWALMLATAPHPAPQLQPGFMQQIEASKESIKQWPQWMKDATISAAATLPVTKPKRKPLSDEQADKLIIKVFGPNADLEWHTELVRAVEEAHGIGDSDA